MLRMGRRKRRPNDCGRRRFRVLGTPEWPYGGVGGEAHGYRRGKHIEFFWVFTSGIVGGWPDLTRKFLKEGFEKFCENRFREVTAVTVEEKIWDRARKTNCFKKGAPA